MSIKEALAQRGGTRMDWAVALQVLEVQAVVQRHPDGANFSRWTVEQIADLVMRRHDAG